MCLREAATRYLASARAEILRALLHCQAKTVPGQFFGGRVDVPPISLFSSEVAPLDAMKPIFGLHINAESYASKVLLIA
jgi:hypothetical protein